MIDSNRRQTVTQWSTAGLILAGFLAFLAPFSPAQTTSGSIVGTVTDSTGGVVPNAAVTLTNTGTSEHRTVQADANGSYRFVNLVPGVYKLDIEVAGFKHLTRDGIQVQVQAEIRIDAAMQVGQISETVEVSAETPLMRTETAELSQMVEGRTVLELPLNGRNVLNLVTLTPGVVPQTGTSGNPMGNLGDVTQPTAWAAYQIGGGQADSSAAFYDGAPINGPYVNAVLLVPTQDSVQEFRVASNSVSAEFGRFSGGVVNFASKSGTNQFHGSLYEYLRNDKLNANDFFANKNGADRPPFRQNQFGANVAGPVFKNKTFFMFSWEDFKLRTAVPYSGSVPTASMNAGDFSAKDAKGNYIFPIIYDPLTVCGAYGNPACKKDANGDNIYVRQPFPGNKIPANRISPTAAFMTSTYALPTYPSVVDPTTQYNYYINGPSGGDQYQINARVDQIISDKQRLFGRYTHWRGTSIPDDIYRNLVSATSFRFLNDSFVLGDTYTLTTKTILEVRISYMNWVFGSYQVNEGLDMCKFGGTSTPNNYCKLNSQLTYRTNIAIGFNALDSTGEWANRDSSRGEVGSLGVTKLAGHHTLKFGSEFRFNEWHHSTLAPPSGEFDFDSTMTAQNATNPGDDGYEYASFLLGYPTGGFARTARNPAMREKYLGMYFTDQMQVGKKLTVNLGLRWELPGSFYERQDAGTVFLPNEASPLAAAVGLPLKGNFALLNSKDYPSRNVHPSHWKLFGPRAGLAYRFGNKTVVRAGYALSYLASDSILDDSPWATPPSTSYTNMVTSLDGGITPYCSPGPCSLTYSTLNNPFPTNVNQPPGHNFNPSTLYGSSAASPNPNVAFPYVQQWNVAVQRELPGSIALEASYAGAKGTHMPLESIMGANLPTFQMNQIPDQYLSLGSALNKLMPNPFYGHVPATAGSLAEPMITQGQLLRPFPQYNLVNNTSNNVGNYSYNAFNVKLEKRLKAGSSLLATYSFSKSLGTSDSLVSWAEAPDKGAVIQDWNNIKGERSLLNYDVPHNFSLSYVLDAPFGKGKKFLSGASGAVEKLVGGWSLNGMYAIRSGYPLHVIANSTQISRNFGGGTPRPNVVAGCDKTLPGSRKDRINKWFNTACFTSPSQFGFGNESRADQSLRADGVNNLDISISKNTSFAEMMKLRFEVEFINAANRVQFLPPHIQQGAGNFGQIYGSRNQPRLIQFALRLTF
jgi:hypothetical protein